MQKREGAGLGTRVFAAWPHPGWGDRVVMVPTAGRR
jgi:hypothetical protein